MKKKIKLLKLIAIFVVGIYIIITLINQQKVLISYTSIQDELSLQIAVQKECQEELEISSQNINSEEYIEKVAREKLGMYKENERVYVNISN